MQREPNKCVLQNWNINTDSTQLAHDVYAIEMIKIEAPPSLSKDGENRFRNEPLTNAIVSKESYKNTFSYKNIARVHVC